MDNEKYKTYPAIQSLSRRTVAHIGMAVIGKTSNKKRVTKRYLDGQSLTMLVVSGVILEKHMTYKIQWDLEEMKKEQEKGADDVRFKYWEKGGFAVLKSFFGNYLVGMMMTLDYTLVTNTKVT